MKFALISLIISVLVFVVISGGVSAANCTNREPITAECECDGVNYTSGYCCYYSFYGNSSNPYSNYAAPNITHQTTQCGYTEVSPHWDHILVYKEVYKYVFPDDPEWAWNALHFDVVHIDFTTWREQLALPGMKQYNPTLKGLAYRIDMTMINKDMHSWFPGGDFDVYNFDLFHERMENYSIANGYNLEDAFLHFSEDTTITLDDGNTYNIPGCDMASRNVSCRAIKYSWNSYRWITNPKSNLSREFYADEWDRTTTTPHGGYVFDGIWRDEHPRSPLNRREVNMFVGLVSGGTILEYGLPFKNPGDIDNQTFLDQYYFDFNEFLYAQRSKTTPNGKIMLMNPATYCCAAYTENMEMVRVSINQSIAAGGATFEYMLNPAIDIESTKNMFDLAETLMDQGLPVVFWTMGEHATVPTNYPYIAGSYSSNLSRARIWILANYYIIKDAENKLAYFSQLSEHGDPFEWYWIYAQEVDVGRPTTDYYIYQNGTTPVPYTIYARNFTKALVLFRPNEYTPYDDTTSVTVNLPETMTPIDHDGSAMTPTNTFDLRNAEAAILLLDSPQQPTCLDVSGDNKVNIIDLALVIFWQGKNSGQGDWLDYQHLDVIQDGAINFGDVSSVIASFGQSC